MMKFVLDHHSLLYMLEQFPRNIATELWELFVSSCKDETFISHREAQKTLEQDAVEEESLKWSRNNTSFFKTTTAAEAELLGVMMDKHEFDFFATPKLVQRRIPEAIPFILCMAKKNNRVFVYRKNTNADCLSKIKKICSAYDIKYMEIEECLLALKDGL